MNINRLLSIFLCLVLLLTLTGCGQSSAPVDPMIHNLSTKMHCTMLSPDGQIFEEYDAQLQLSITDYKTAQDYINITLPLSAKSEYTSNHESVTFQIQQEDQSLPYYCMKVYLYHRETGTLSPFDLAIDIEKECMIFKPASVEDEYYIVASSNSMIQPSSIINYFSDFLLLYDYSE